MTGKDARVTVSVAMLGLMVIIGHQVAAKATRSALYLASFPVTSLPLMTMAAALSSLLLVALTSQAMAAVGPARLIPGAFCLSALLHIVEWTLFPYAPKPVAVLFYLHFSIFGALLISGFWAVVNERLDPHSSKKYMGRITGGGAIGSLLGGLLAERVGAALPVASMLPMLGLLHLAGAGVVLRLRPAVRRGSAEPRGDNLDAGMAVLAKLPYLRNLAALIFLGAMAAQMIDYVFLARTSAAFTGGGLLRVLALFNMATGVIGFLAQTMLTRPLLERAGLGATVGALPATVAVGSLACSFLPGMGSAIFARGAELIIRNSLFRHGYELFYSSVPPAEKRLAKPLIDVGCERLGDIAGSAANRVLLALLTSLAQPAMLALAGGLGLAGLWFARQLDRGYVTALEKSLRNRAVELKLEDAEDRTTRESILRVAVAPAPKPIGEVHGTGPADPLLQRLAEMRSSDPARVHKALQAPVTEPVIAAQAIQLLAWNELAEDAIRALRAAGPAIAGQLTDAMLLDRGDNFSIRRRIPRVLSAFASPRAVVALMQGLADRRFEVRYRCGQALAAIASGDPQLTPAREEVLAAIGRELELGKDIWQSHQLLDGYDQDQFVGARANRGLEHVFTLLSLILPAEPLRISYQALHTTDEMLRGTAFEYLESTLPASVWALLWPYLADGPSPEPTQRKREEILAQLLESHESIQLRLLEARAAGTAHPA